MKRRVLCAVAGAVFLAASPLSAQSPWQWQYPSPQGNTLNDVDVTAPATAIAVGMFGAVVKTTDGGVTWSASPIIAAFPNLRGVRFVTATTVVAVGDGGVVMRSINGGQTWHPRVSGTTDNLLGVDFTDALHGTAVGANGVILRSDDGGATWSPQSSPTSQALRAVSAIDANTATAVGGAGTILRTIDGGTTWLPQTSATTATLFDVDFIDANTGIAAGAGPVALGTTDGGATWLPQPMPMPVVPPSDLHAVDMVDALNAVIVGTYDPDWLMVLQDTGLLMHTSDGGAFWNWTTGPSHMYGVAMFSASEGVAVGAAGIIRRTTDGGASWAQVAGGLQRFSMSGVDFFDTMRGVAVSGENRLDQPSSRVYATTDGGVSWTVTQPFSWSAAIDVAFADASTVYAVGHGPAVMDAGAVIWRSTDGGVSWGEIFNTCCPPCAPTCIQTLTAVDFAGLDTGVAVGTGGAIVTILGGTATWVSSPTTENLHGVSVPTAATAYAVGDNGAILKGSPGADSWALLASGTSATLYDVCFVDELNGTVVGSMGTILHTNDGGDTWTPQASGTTALLQSVSFINADNGVIGAGTTLLKTGNGGTAWMLEAAPAVVADLDYIDWLNMVAVGGSENIVAQKDVPVPVLFQDVTASVRQRSVELRWIVGADDAISGFRVYRGAGGAGEVVVSDGLVPPGARSFRDERVESGRSYSYTVAAVDELGNEIRSLPVAASVPRGTVALLQNHPNPFNPVTRIRYELPSKMPVTLTIFDVTGRRVVTLVEGVQPGGAHMVTWNGRDGGGRAVVTGIYFYELATPEMTLTKKMVLLK